MLQTCNIYARSSHNRSDSYDAEIVDELKEMLDDSS